MTSDRHNLITSKEGYLLFFLLSFCVSKMLRDNGRPKLTYTPKRKKVRMSPYITAFFEQVYINLANSTQLDLGKDHDSITHTHAARPKDSLPRINRTDRTNPQRTPNTTDHRPMSWFSPGDKRARGEGFRSSDLLARLGALL